MVVEKNAKVRRLLSIPQCSEIETPKVSCVIASVDVVCTTVSSTFIMLSEKAKGKQRAVEVEDLIPSKELCIRFTEGIPDLTLQVGEQDAVRDIKIKVLFCLLYY